MLPELVAFIVELIIMAVVFYVAGITVVGKKLARPSNALVIALLGTAIANICVRFFSTYLTLNFDSIVRLNIGVILSLVGWLLLIKYYYETGWFRAIAIGLVAVAIFIVLLFILDFLQVIPFTLFESTMLPFWC